MVSYLYLARADVQSSNLTDDIGFSVTKKQPSPRRLERFPVYVLNVKLSPDEVDAAYDARKTTIGYQVRLKAC